MLLRIVLVTEILSSLICIHYLYGKKCKMDMSMLSLIIVLLIVLEAINYFQWNYLTTFVTHMILFVYCKKKFCSSITETTIILVLYVIIVTSIQFCFGLLSNIFFYQNKTVCYYARSILTLMFCIKILPKCSLSKLREYIYDNRKNMYRVLGIICLVVFILLLNGKIKESVQLEYFILAIPCIIVVLYLLLKWGNVSVESKRLEKELYVEERTKENFDNLLTAVRIHQHAFKNHLMAIISTHYTYKTYEQLVEAQNQYYKHIQTDNQYTQLLLLADRVIAGYLYGKIQEAEEKGVMVKYGVTTFLDDIDMPAYQVIEMLGILLDNAVEAAKENEEPEIFVEIVEQDYEYRILVRNPYKYVSYGEIQSWFLLNKSQKGEGRGIGLYHLKKICYEWKCILECRNTEYENINWIEFTIKIKKQTAA